MEDTMKLSAAKDRELRDRGRSWLYYIGVISCDNEDIVQNSIIKLHNFHESYPDVDAEHFADKNWKKCLNQAYIDWVRKRGAYNSMLERYADSVSNQPEREEFIFEAREVLLETFPQLSARELEVVLALMENDFVQTWAAEELGVSKQYIQASISRVRTRLTPEFDLTHNPNAKGKGADVKYRVKRTTNGLVISNNETWTSFLSGETEVVLLEDLHREEYTDRVEAAKIHPVTITKGE